jgi:transglutaminase-like putative cysteine protease
VPEWLRPYVRPREGWLSYLLLLVMLFSLSWAVQAADWLEKAAFLIPVAFFASLLGALLALTPLSVVITLPLSAIVGAWVVLWTVGGEYFPLVSQVDRLLSLRVEAVDFTRTVLSYGYPNELTPYAIGLAVIMWVTAFIAAYTLYRHHRALDAILLVGAALIADMSATFVDLFGYLVLFSLAALLLWLRAALVTREEGWRRRRVNENKDVPAAIMRTGVVFIGVAIVLSWSLASVAAAQPLSDAWRNLDTVWSSVRDRFENLFGGLTNPESRISGNSFGTRFTVTGSWFANDTNVLLVSEDHPYYLLTVTYDKYTGHGWASTSGTERSVPRNQVIFGADSPETPTTTEGFTPTTITVKIEEPIGRNLFTPGYPLRISAPSVITQPGGYPLLGALSAQSSIDNNQGYSIDAVISNVGSSGVSAAQLRSAGQVYPPSIRALYMDASAVTTQTKNLAEQIVRQAGATNPYDEANALAQWLASPSLSPLRYATNVGSPPANRDLVDFFLFDATNGQRGYCQYFASAMAMMARSLGLPARVAAGFAPGSAVAGVPNEYLYKESNAHVWAQIYFPGYGWQTFEATQTIDPQFTRATGANEPPPSPGASGDPVTSWLDKIKGQIPLTQPSLRPIQGGTVAGGPDQPAGVGDARPGNVLIVLAILLLVGGAIWWRMRRAGRRARLLAPGERQWALLLAAADRAGVSQRVSETDYEYAAWLEEQIPTRRPEIRTIADAKVWGSYSGRRMPTQTVARMQAAWHRLRMPLVWLTVRRRLRSLLPRRG